MPSSSTPSFSSSSSDSSEESLEAITGAGEGKGSDFFVELILLDEALEPLGRCVLPEVRDLVAEGIAEKKQEIESHVL
jgi:hypothetical protein